MNSAKRTNFFATKQDLEPGLERIESKHDLQYVRCGHYPTDVPDAYGSWWDIPDLGINNTGDHLGTAYLVIGRAAKPVLRRIDLTSGEVSYVVDQQQNPESVVFRPGGKYRAEVLVCGHIETLAQSRTADSLRREFAASVVEGFEKVGNYKVGPQAAKLLDSGFRLVTIGIGSPREYDLRRAP
jgi:hypothetical protein